MRHSDDNVVAGLVSQFRDISSGVPTISKMTAAYNFTIGVFRLFTVQGEEKWVKGLAKDFHKGLMEEINHCYEREKK